MPALPTVSQCGQILSEIAKFDFKSSNSIWNRQIRFEIVKFDLKSPNSIWYCTEILMALWFYKVSFLKKLNNANLIIKIPKFKWNFKKVFDPFCVWYEEDGCRRPAGRQISLNYFSTYAQWEFGVTSFQFGWIQLILKSVQLKTIQIWIQFFV